MSAAHGSSSPPASPIGGSFRSYEQTQKAIDAIQNKAPVEDTDFTIHIMEDGSEVSTLERVCKGNHLSLLPPLKLIFSSSIFIVCANLGANRRPSSCFLSTIG